MRIVRLHPRSAESETRGRGPDTSRGFPRRLQSENSYCAPSRRITGKHGVARLPPDPKATSDLSWDPQLQSPVAPGQWLSLASNVFLSLIRETSGTVLLCEEHWKGPHLCRVGLAFALGIPSGTACSRHSPRAGWKVRVPGCE